MYQIKDTFSLNGKNYFLSTVDLLQNFPNPSKEDQQMLDMLGGRYETMLFPLDKAGRTKDSIYCEKYHFKLAAISRHRELIRKATVEKYKFWE